MKLYKILDLKVKLKTDEIKFQPIMTVKWEEKVLQCDKCEVKLSRQDPQENNFFVCQCVHLPYNYLKFIHYFGYNDDIAVS